MPAPTYSPGDTWRYAASYSRMKSNFRFVPELEGASAPSAYVFWLVQAARLSAWIYQRSSVVNIPRRLPNDVCFICVTLRPAFSDEMRVVFGSPRKNAMLL